jgi:hypothetical protein
MVEPAGGWLCQLGHILVHNQEHKWILGIFQELVKYYVEMPFMSSSIAIEKTEPMEATFDLLKIHSHLVLGTLVLSPLTPC